MSTFLTIFSGVTVYVIGQLIVKLVVDPVQAYKSTVGEISIVLIKFANVYANPGVHPIEKNDAAMDEFRYLASKLSSQINLIPKYETTAKIFSLPTKDKIHEVKSKLIFLSNNLHTRGHDRQEVSPGELNCRQADKISDYLGIYVPANLKAYGSE